MSPSHVYHEVDIAWVRNDLLWFSWGEKKGVFVLPEVFIKIFVREFSFDTRYSQGDFIPDKSNFPLKIPILATFVSSGGGDVWTGDMGIYAYEITKPEGYNQLLENGWEQTSIQFGPKDESERLALTAMGYALLAEAKRRVEIQDSE